VARGGVGGFLKNEQVLGPFGPLMSDGRKNLLLLTGTEKG
jgi:hypothetical protein